MMKQNLSLVSIGVVSDDPGRSKGTLRVLAEGQSRFVLVLCLLIFAGRRVSLCMTGR
jgi:hypothetical protein